MISFSSTLPFGSPVGRNNTALLGLDPGDPDVLAILENDYIKNLLSSLLPPVKQSLSDLLKERALDLVTETADLACIGDFQAVNDFARGNIDFTTTVERFFKQADIDLMLGATVTALTNYFTRGALGTYAIPETLAVAKASKFLRKDFPDLCTNFFSKKAGKGTTGKLKSAGEVKPQKVDDDLKKYMDYAKHKGAGYANNLNNKLRLDAELAFKQAGILDDFGKLTAKAVQNAKRINLAEGEVKNKAVRKILTKDGSKITDWGKFTTESVKLGNGQKKQIHFYKNLKNGKVDYETIDYKIKDEIAIAKGVK